MNKYLRVYEPGEKSRNDQRAAKEQLKKSTSLSVLERANKQRQKNLNGVKPEPRPGWAAEHRRSKLQKKLRENKFFEEEAGYREPRMVASWNKSAGYGRRPSSVNGDISSDVYEEPEQRRGMNATYTNFGKFHKEEKNLWKPFSKTDQKMSRNFFEIGRGNEKFENYEDIGYRTGEGFTPNRMRKTGVVASDGFMRKNFVQLQNQNHNSGFESLKAFKKNSEQRSIKNQSYKQSTSTMGREEQLPPEVMNQMVQLGKQMKVMSDQFGMQMSTLSSKFQDLAMMMSNMSNLDSQHEDIDSLAGEEGAMINVGRRGARDSEIVSMQGTQGYMKRRMVRTPIKIQGRDLQQKRGNIGDSKQEIMDNKRLRNAEVRSSASSSYKFGDHNFKRKNDKMRNSEQVWRKEEHEREEQPADQNLMVSLLNMPKDKLWSWKQLIDQRLETQEANPGEISKRSKPPRSPNPQSFSEEAEQTSEGNRTEPGMNYSTENLNNEPEQQEEAQAYVYIEKEEQKGEKSGAGAPKEQNETLEYSHSKMAGPSGIMDLLPQDSTILQFSKDSFLDGDANAILGESIVRLNDTTDSDSSILEINQYIKESNLELWDILPVQNFKKKNENENEER